MQQSSSKRPLIVWLLIGLLAFVAAFFSTNFVYERTLGRRQVTIGVNGKWSFSTCRTGQLQIFQESEGPYTPCSILDTDHGYFKLGGYGLFGDDSGNVVWNQLTQGCHYRVIIQNSMLGGRQSGNQIPPEDMVVRLLGRIEPTATECDISDKSGKPLCREDQVFIRAGGGVLPVSRDCDFQSFARGWKPSTG
jgi:hypothetical protein